jgi:hypothetical protein
MNFIETTWKNFLLDKKEKKILIKWFLESSKNRPKKFSQNFIFHFVILTKNYLFAVRKQKNKKEGLRITPEPSPLQIKKTY